MLKPEEKYACGHREFRGSVAVIEQEQRDMEHAEQRRKPSCQTIRDINERLTVEERTATCICHDDS